MSHVTTTAFLTKSPKPIKSKLMHQNYRFVLLCLESGIQSLKFKGCPCLHAGAELQHGACSWEQEVIPLYSLLPYAIKRFTRLPFAPHQKESQSSTSWYKVKNILHIHIVLHRTWHHLVDFHGGAWRCLRQLMAQNSFHICSHVCYFVFGPPAARSQNKLAT